MDMTNCASLRRDEVDDVDGDEGLLYAVAAVRGKK